MNIVYLIGNGFDLSLGLKTSYSHFMKWYESLSGEEKNSAVTKFIEHVKREQQYDDKWSDIELALGMYTSELGFENLAEDAKSLHEELVDYISEYIGQQDNQIIHDPQHVNKLHRYLKYPEADNRLLENENVFLKNKYRWKWNNNQWSINIISFNYTQSIEKLLNFEEPIDIGPYYLDNYGKTRINEIEHIHGFAQERLILGVDNVSQIENKLLHDTTVPNWYIKSNTNAKTGLNHDMKCMQWVEYANLICVFGFSIGKTDMRWWRKIVERLFHTDCRFILFYYDPKISFSPNRVSRREEFKERCKDFFIQQAEIELNDTQKSSIKDRIFVSLNSDMFKF